MREVILEPTRAEWPVYRSPLADEEEEEGKEEEKTEEQPKEEVEKVEEEKEKGIVVSKDDIASIVSAHRARATGQVTARAADHSRFRLASSPICRFVSSSASGQRQKARCERRTGTWWRRSSCWCARRSHSEPGEVVHSKAIMHIMPSHHAQHSLAPGTLRLCAQPFRSPSR